MPSALLPLCGIHGCRRPQGHSGAHTPHPTLAWDFLEAKDKNKIKKTGTATPRGGAKGAYQNHVNRTNKVILPYEKFINCTSEQLDAYENGYVISLRPKDYFAATGQPYTALAGAEPVVVGDNAFVLYRSADDWQQLPPLPGWQVRAMHDAQGNELDKRKEGTVDSGHYVVRISTGNGGKKRAVGPVQGIFAPEYANDEDNYLAKCVLAYLIVRTSGSPYVDSQARLLQSILANKGLGDGQYFTRKGILVNGLTQCPLCNRPIRYEELHSVIDFEEGIALQNATTQTEGATRSTAANLFHVLPLVYDELRHTLRNVAWGHAICNTVLGQRACISLTEMQESGLKVATLDPEGVLNTFGWISDDREMIRSSSAVWIRIVPELEAGEPEAAAEGEEEHEQAEDEG